MILGLAPNDKKHGIKLPIKNYYQLTNHVFVHQLTNHVGAHQTEIILVFIKYYKYLD